jgi:putative NADPH-quinone reductase
MPRSWKRIWSGSGGRSRTAITSFFFIRFGGAELPAKLKGLFDRILFPGKAFTAKKGASLPTKSLTGKTARVFITSDTSSRYLYLFLGVDIVKQIKWQILSYVGFAPVRVSNFVAARYSASKQRDGWLRDVGHLAGKIR